MSAPLFRLRGVHYAYDPTRPILVDAGLELFPGERVALTGPNGAGKTTLLHIIVGLLEPAAGEVEAFGTLRRCERDFEEVRARAGLLFQNPDDQLFCPTVAEDVAFGPLNLGKKPAEAWAIVRRVLADLGLAGFENRVTHKLSGGERRLVSLATVLAMQPEVLLLDEPSNALDSPTEERLVSILGRLPQAMVVISHDHDFLARVTQRRCRLDRGRLTPA